jgi:molybdenum cofactor biosynthesis protein B
MSETVNQHRFEAPRQVRFAVITVSDTRTLDTDLGGQTVVELLGEAGQILVHREITPDEPPAMTAVIRQLVARDDVDAILMTGGTGVSSRDQTFETVSALLTKTLPGYGELFRQLSFEQIGAAAMLSRALGGVIDGTVLLTMPGSPAAVELAMRRLILPEIGHILRELRR